MRVLQTASGITQNLAKVFLTLAACRLMMSQHPDPISRDGECVHKKAYYRPLNAIITDGKKRSREAFEPILTKHCVVPGCSPFVWA